MAQPSILIIACDHYLAGIYGRKFELDGWEVEIAEELSVGERKIVRHRPDIVLLDVDCLADLGSELVRLRAFPTIQKTRIVLLAEALSRQMVREARLHGITDYLHIGHFLPQEAVLKMRRLLAVRA
jgi:DNA-binding response OmpR family regulator